MSLSSPIDCIESKNLTINKQCRELLNVHDLNSFEAVWHFAGGKVLKKIRERSVIRIELQHGEVTRYYYLKRHANEFVGLRGILTTVFKKKNRSQGRNEFQNICDFRQCGLPTVLPVVVGEKYNRGFWVTSFLITEDFHPFISLESLLVDQPDFFAGSKAKQKRLTLIREISLIARKMHKCGFNHLDFNATHILVYYQKTSDIPEIALFDLQRVARNKFFRFRWMIKCLARLNHTLPKHLFDDDDRLHLLLYYKNKDKLNAFDKFQWFYITKKTERIKRHAENKRKTLKRLPSEKRYE